MRSMVGILREIYDTAGALGDTQLKDALGDLYDEIGEVLEVEKPSVENERLTWADVKVGDVIEEQSRLRGLVLRISNNGMIRILLTNGGIVSRLADSPPPLQILGRFDELGCELNLERGGFTIPDEVLNPEPKPVKKEQQWTSDGHCVMCGSVKQGGEDEAEAETQAKPAVEFMPGEWFESPKYGKRQRAWNGCVQYGDKGHLVTWSEDDLIHLPEFENCHPCEPDFFIFTADHVKKMEASEEAAIKELDEVKEGFDALAIAVGKYFGHDVGEHSSVNCPITNAYDLLRTTKANTPNHSNEGDDSAGEDYVGELIDMAIDFSDPYTISDLMDVAEKARDQYGQQQKPTIPQELRELVQCLDDYFNHISDDGIVRLQKTGQAYHILQECKRTFERCEPPKPHPLTAVREFITYGCNLYGSEKACELNWKAQAARRELAEYDGVDDSGQSGSGVENG